MGNMRLTADLKITADSLMESMPQDETAGFF